MPHQDKAKKPALITKPGADAVHATARKLRALLDAIRRDISPAERRANLVQLRERAAAMREELAPIRARCHQRQQQLTTLQEQLRKQRDRLTHQQRNRPKT